MACGRAVNAFRDVSVTQKINALRVKCSNSYWGCEWTGELGHLGEHLVTCEQKPAKCSSCGLFVPKDICRDHESLHCPKRTHTCTFCSNFTSTYEKVQTMHWPHCPKYPIDCPNGCSSSLKIPRDQLMTHLREACQMKQKIEKMAETIETLEITLEQKERRIEELEAEVQGNEKQTGERSSNEKSAKKSRGGLFKRRGSKPYDEVGKDTIEEISTRPRVTSDDARGLVNSGGKERNFEREVKLLKECIAEKVSEIEQLRLRNVEQCTSMAQMEEDFTTQLKALKSLCKRLSDEKEKLEMGSQAEASTKQQQL
jgi:hypothetical protein